LSQDLKPKQIQEFVTRRDHLWDACLASARTMYDASYHTVAEESDTDSSSGSGDSGSSDGNSDE
jgi:hypothetical protein